MHKNSSLRSIHSQKLFQRLRTVCRECQRQGVENPNSSVVAGTMKVLAKSSCGYWILDCNRQPVTKYMNDGKTHIVINKKMFKRLNPITDQLSQVKLVKPQFEHREPISSVLGFLFYNKLNRESWNFSKNSSRSFVTLTSMKNLKWTQTPSTWICWKKICKTFFSLKTETSGMRCVQ